MFQILYSHLKYYEKSIVKLLIDISSCLFGNDLNIQKDDGIFVFNT